MHVHEVIVAREIRRGAERQDSLEHVQARSVYSHGVFRLRDATESNRRKTSTMSLFRSSIIRHRKT